ncbi:hypothetical protein GCM10009737_00960 [Nocardioides lentus]|uniref:Secreted protein n=1 Tax=Nocardioides lentus TaxID=338077 RepID=A0ABP5A7G3_9ACTN
MTFHVAPLSVVTVLIACAGAPAYRPPLTSAATAAALTPRTTLVRVMCGLSSPPAAGPRARLTPTARPTPRVSRVSRLCKPIQVGTSPDGTGAHPGRLGVRNVRIRADSAAPGRDTPIRRAPECRASEPGWT